VRRILQEIQALEVPEDQLTESQRAILANLALPSDA
jgi:hypothetical protein